MKILITALLVLAVVVVLAVAIMGTDRSETYVKGTREVAQKKIDKNVPTEVKIEGLKADVRKAEYLAVGLSADSAVTKGSAAVLDRKRDELKIAIAKLETEVENGKALLREKREKYLINGTEYTLQALYDIVVKKAETLKGHREDLQYLEENQANTERMANIQEQRAEELGRNVAREKRDIIRMEQRHGVAKTTADVARRTAMLGELNDPFSDNAHVEILRSVEKDISLLEAKNRHAFMGSDIYGNEIDLTTIGPEQDWDSVVDQIDVISGTSTPQATAASVTSDSPTTASTAE